MSSFAGATVFHTAMPRKGSSVFLRMAGWLGFHILSIGVSLLKVGKVDVLLAPSPPLSIGVVAWVVGAIKRAPFIYNVQELYPDTAVNLGALREGAFLKLLRRMERFVYDRAFAVTAIAPRMHQEILRRTDPKKVRLIPNFVDTDLIGPRPRDNPFAREFGLNGRFTVVYAGNMGPAQRLDTLIEAAEITQGEPKILYVFVGSGTSRLTLANLVSEKKLSNVRFVPHQPYERVPDIYGASDLCLVPLAPTLTAEAVPSKVYRIMSAERRILAIADDHSDLASVVRESGGGAVVPPGDPDALAAAILAEAKTQGAMGADRPTGRPYVLRHADRKSVTRQYSELMQEAVEARTGPGA
jgi:colanic acid biosynthesis glycosyl transferase WcaI